MYEISLDSYINKLELQNVLSYQNMAVKFFKEKNHIDSNSSFGIGSSTYRVFRKLKQQPSKVFKDRAYKLILNEDIKKQLLLCNNREKFNIIHNFLGNDLSDCWFKNQSQKLLLAHKNKLLDLFFKYLTRIELGNIDINENILNYAHIPLDSKTLPIINCLLNGIFSNNDLTMGSIKTIESYNYIQEIVYIITKKNNSLPLYLDYYANHKI